MLKVSADTKAELSVLSTVRLLLHLTAMPSGWRPNLRCESKQVSCRRMSDVPRSLAQAKEFAEGVRAVFPDQWLAYNLSPSFNWDAAGLDEAAMKNYIWELGKLGL